MKNVFIVCLVVLVAIVLVLSCCPNEKELIEKKSELWQERVDQVEQLDTLFPKAEKEK